MLQTLFTFVLFFQVLSYTFHFSFRLRHEKDMIVNLKHEQEKLDKVVKQEEDEIEKLKNVLDVIER